MNTLGTDERGCTHRDKVLRVLRDATAALESDDQGAFDRLIERIAGPRQNQLAIGVAHLAHRVQEAMHKIDIDSRLACIAGRDIPDARSHLDYVVQMTEKAAHRTLDLVDASRDCVTELSSLHATLSCAPVALRQTLEHLIGKLNSNLSDLGQAQEYQDLSGQMIRRVITLVQEIESALVDLIGLSGLEHGPGAVSTTPPAAAAQQLGARMNPASTQQDADQLLADLGF